MANIRKKREDFQTESAWRTYILTHPEEKEEEEIEVETETTIYYVCKNPKCDFIKKQTVSITPSQLEEIVNLLPKGKCPNCGTTGFKKLSKEEYEKELKRIENLKKKNLEEENQKTYKREATSEAQKILHDALNEIKELYEDLRHKLQNKDITPKCFVTLFYNISFDIMNSVNKSYRKKYYAGLIDLKSERKTILDMGQIVLDLYDIEEEQSNIIERYDKEADENYQAIYNAYNSKYELGKDEEFEDYKRETRLENYISDIQRKRALQEKNSDRIIDSSKKRAEKMQSKEENSFAESLTNYVNKIDKM